MYLMHKHWHTQSLQEVLSLLQTTETGLRSHEAQERLVTHGPNELPAKKRESLFVTFIRQFQSSLIYVLLISCVIVFLIGEKVDGVIILIVLIFNAIVGVIQEGRAQNTLSALKQYVETNATVLRDGKEIIIPDREVVPGDVVVIIEGERVPADARIIRAVNCLTDESSLTGESKPVEKCSECLASSDLPVADQKNMLFKGTVVVSGHVVAVVIATGASTQMGSIAKEIATIDTDIPLKKNIADLSRIIIAVVACIAAVLFVLGIARGEPVQEMFTTVVALAMSAIPEGLPVVVTLVLATGVWRMSKRHALVKRLQAVEGLGQARIIAVDKTGTLTKNEMTVQSVYVDGVHYAIGGVGYESHGEASVDGEVVVIPDHPDLLTVARFAALSTEAHVAYYEEQKKWRVFGDPTEASLTVFAEKCGFLKDELEKEFTKMSEVPFSFQEKYRAIGYESKSGPVIAVAGAPEAIFSRVTHIWTKEGVHKMTPQKKESFEEEIVHYSKKGFRVLAIAMRETKVQELTDKEVHELTLVGLVAMKDPLRAEVAGAMVRTKEAGIRVVMMTGDHKLTALSIATEAGIFHEGDGVITGTEIDALSDAEFAKHIGRISVFARVTPEHKLRIIKAYRAHGAIVAMTGDGVNDAPSLVAADLGVAMGGTGTEVAKEASDIILLDDNFGTIVSAVEEGRSIYRTIQKVITYLFSTNMGETFTITSALIIGLPLPVLPAQIIWLNLVTDTFLDVSLAMEPKEKGLLNKKNFKPSKYILDRIAVVRSLLMAIVMTLGSLTLFVLFLDEGMTKALAISLTTLAVFQWFNAWNCRHESKSLFTMNPLSNPYLIAAMTVVVTLHIVALSVPFMQTILHTTPLSLTEWGLIIGVASSIIVAEEIRKLIMRMMKA